MKETNETKKTYETPLCEVIEMEPQGVIAASDGKFGGFGWEPKDA